MIILNIFNSTSCIHQVKRLVIKACVSIFIMPEFMSRGIQKYHLCPLFVWNVSPKGSAICVSSIGFKYCTLPKKLPLQFITA